MQSFEKYRSIFLPSDLDLSIVQVKKNKQDLDNTPAYVEAGREKTIIQNLNLL